MLIVPPEVKESGASAVAVSSDNFLSAAVIAVGIIVAISFCFYDKKEKS